MNEQERASVRTFLEQQRARFTINQWMESYQSWAHGGRAWNRYGLGGTDIVTALTWYQHVHKPGSKEWRPKIIMAAVRAAACLATAVERVAA